MPNCPPPRAGVPSWLARSADVVGRLLVLAAGVALLAFLAAQLRLLVVTLAVGVLLAAVGDPLARAAARRGARDWAAPLAIVLVLLVVALGVAAGLGARLAAELPELRRQLDDAAAQVSAAVGIDLPVPGRSGEGDGTTEGGTQGSSDGAQEGSGASPSTDRLAGVAAGVLEALFGFFLALAFAFLLLKDGRRMWAWAISHVDAEVGRDVHAAGRAAWGTLGTYVRGLTVVALFDAVGIGVGLVLLGVPLALTLAVLQFLASYVPTVGAFVAGAVAVAVALVGAGPVPALLTLVLVIVVQQIGNDVIEPWVMGHGLGVHPIVVLIAVTAGGLLWGVAGALLFVPLTAAVTAAARELRMRRAPRDLPASSELAGG